MKLSTYCPRCRQPILKESANIGPADKVIMSHTCQNCHMLLELTYEKGMTTAKKARRKIRIDPIGLAIVIALTASVLLVILLAVLTGSGRGYGYYGY
jgi:hypothetical protein